MSPAMKTRRELPVLIVGAVAATAAFFVDGALTHSITAEPLRHQLERAVNVPLAIGIYAVVVAILASFSNAKRLCGGFLVTVIVSGGLTHLLKWAIGRARPLADLGACHFEPFAGGDYMDAFPSGHSAGAATLALLLGLYFPRARWIFYVLALCVGVERVVTRWHYGSDVLAGWVLAGAVVFTFVRLLGPGWFTIHTVSQRPLT